MENRELTVVTSSSTKNTTISKWSLKTIVKHTCMDTNDGLLVTTSDFCADDVTEGFLNNIIFTSVFQKNLINKNHFILIHIRKYLIVLIHIIDVNKNFYDSSIISSLCF